MMSKTHVTMTREKKQFMFSEWRKKYHFNSSCFVPAKNCYSEQQIEVISVIVRQVMVTELTTGLTAV